MQEAKFIEKYFFLGLLILTLVFVSLVFSPFLAVIVMGIAVSTAMYPLYKMIKKIIPDKVSWIASLLTIILFLILLWVPLMIVGSVAYDQFFSLYDSFDITNGDPVLNTLNDKINEYIPAGFDFDLQTEAIRIISSVFSNITNLFTATINTIFLFFLVVLTMFYTFVNGERWKSMFIKLSPLENDHNEKIIKTLASTINGIVKGYLLIALVQGLLMGIGLYIFGVPHPALWGVVAAIMSLIPTIGTALVSVPSILYLLATGSDAQAIGLTIWSVAIVGTIDNLLNPLIVGKQTDLPPIIVLFSVLGGLAMMGPMGIVIGPLSVSLLRALFMIYKEEIK
jgi:predicted PurR-regulated permease PerM